ncbi:AEC family transporter [Pseudactinotalea sp. Z1739]|uniref:AEC family transporter n=1 Tax=Pseudactinotalea sp. Z1739 TaxID=3413028 RepID=UPI003C7CAAB8
MTAVLQGFAVLGAIIALGALLAHVRLLGEESQQMLAKLAFFVASPALMITVMADADVATLFSLNLAVTSAAVVVSGSTFLLISRLWFKRAVPETVIGTLSSMYVNAGNLGLPIAAYVLGDASLVAPVLLLQLIVLQPLALAVLDRSTAAAGTSRRALTVRTVTNPLLLGALVGLALALTGWEMPMVLAEPVNLIAGMAVPSMLLAYGVSLRVGPRAGRGVGMIEVGTTVFLKLIIQPVSAFLIGWAVGLDEASLFAVVVLAALPAAQNVFVHAVRYNRGVVLARDSIFLSTVLCPVALLVIAGLLT